MYGIIEQVPLIALCRQITDGTHDSPRLLEKGVPFIKGKHISSGRINFEDCDYISHEDHLKVIERSKPEQGDTLFSNIGSVGDMAYVDTDREFSIKNVALFKPCAERVDPKYLFYLLKSPEVRQGLLARRSGSAQPFVALATLREHLVQYHAALDEQRRIASILGAYDDLIEVNRRRIALLEEMARRLFDEWIGQFIAPEAVTQGAKIKLPEGWHSVQLGDLATEIRAGVMPSEVAQDVPYVGLEHLPRRSTTLTGYGTVDNVSSLKFRFQKWDVLFGKIRPYFHKVAVAPFDGICSSDTIIMRPRGFDAWGLLLSIASSDRFVAHSVATSNGTKMPRANWPVLSRYPVPIPPPGILSSFNRFVVDAVEAAAIFQAANLCLQRARDLLLPRLMSGNLTVAAAEQELADAA